MNKEQGLGEENVEEINQTESCRVPQSNSNIGKEIRKVQPITFQNVDQSPFGIGGRTSVELEEEGSFAAVATGLATNSEIVLS